MSARRGFSREIISLAAWILALILGMWFYGTAGSLLLPYVSSPRIANLIGFLLVVFGVMLCGNFLGWIVSRFLKTIGLSFPDRLLGAAFGLLKGLIVSIALLTAFVAFGPVVEQSVEQSDNKTVNGTSGTRASAVLHSQIAPYILEASHWAVAIAPMELKSSFQSEYARVKAALGDIRTGGEAEGQGKPKQGKQ
jgi:membrane protein required for colicin V production